MSEAEQITNLIGEIIFVIGAAIFAHFEKQRRWSRMEAKWPNGAGAQKEMSTSLCECAGCNANCLRHCCCTGIMAGMNRAELDGRQWQCPDYWSSIAPGGANTYLNRQEIRARLKMAPDPCMDCCCTCWCGPCVTAQNTVEVEKLVGAAPAAV